MKEYVIGKQMTGDDIRRLRFVLGMTQKEFAAFAGCSPRTVENWETRETPVTGPIVTLAEILLRKPQIATKLEVPAPRGKMRLWYYFKSTVCTIIDVNESEREVAITNYITDPLFRAFGVNTEPTWEDYEEFLKSRCFPDTRDKIKLELRELGIPFYDPMMIIEKTQGRMAEDDFWIRVERKSI